eukprot:13890715-Alexandrium_andersonii.AAC.1
MCDESDRASFPRRAAGSRHCRKRPTGQTDRTTPGYNGGRGCHLPSSPHPRATLWGSLCLLSPPRQPIRALKRSAAVQGTTGYPGIPTKPQGA